MKKIFMLICLAFGLGTIASAQQYEGISNSIKVNVDDNGIPDGAYYVSIQGI